MTTLPSDSFRENLTVKRDRVRVILARRELVRKPPGHLGGVMRTGEKPRIPQRPHGNLGPTKPYADRVQRRGNRVRRNATYRREKLRFTTFRGSVQNEERADIITIPTHVGVENDGNGDTRLLALCPREVHAEQPARSESK